MSSAASSLHDRHSYPDTYKALEAVAKPMPAVTHRDDWRVKHHEARQLPAQFFAARHHYRRTAGTVTFVTIGIQPEIYRPLARLIEALVGRRFSRIEQWTLGATTPHEVDEEDEAPNQHESYEWIEIHVEKKVDSKAKKVSKKRKAAAVVCARVSTSNGHRQLRASDLIDVVESEQAERQKASSSSARDTFLLLINEDLFDGDESLFVAGLAHLGTGIGVFSTFRYALDFRVIEKDSYWFDCTTAKDMHWEFSIELLRRLGRLGAHELLHLFGILHCLDFACMMNGSGHLSEDLQQPLLLCPVDLYKLASAQGFDDRAELIERYLKPLHIELTRLELNTEAQQVHAMLQLL